MALAVVKDMTPAKEAHFKSQKSKDWPSLLLQVQPESPEGLKLLQGIQNAEPLMAWVVPVVLLLFLLFSTLKSKVGTSQLISRAAEKRIGPWNF